jgi:hypothetical protein
MRMDLQQIITADPAKTGKAAIRLDPATKPTKAKGAKGAKPLTDEQKARHAKILAKLQSVGTQPIP